MQNSSDKSQPKQDESYIHDKLTGTNGIEDPMITIEYLRARLLSERSISKATKDRADELSKRVKELEEQLKVVTHQRKRAEKATLDVLSYLDGFGVSDVSEVYESDSNEEDSQYESNMDNGETTLDDKKLDSLEVKKKDEESGSEAESTPSGRSLSWKGRKDITRHPQKKYLDSPIRSRTSHTQVNSSPRHRLGRSCRKIKRREPRSAFEEARHECGKSEDQDGNAMNGLDHLDFRSERGSEKEEVSHSFQAQECDAISYTHERESSGEMDRALKHQAQLIRSYEAQEKAQRDWEEKYGDNNDSCEPGSHSDVTEERDDNKATVPHPVEANPCHNLDQKAGTEANSPGNKLLITQFNSFKLSRDADTESSEKHNARREMQPPASAVPDFDFSVTKNSNESWNHDARHSSKHSCQVDPPQKLDRPHKGPAELGVVLDALHEAKLLIKQQMNSLPETSNDIDWLKPPVGCLGLFRVPTDHVDAAISQPKSLCLDYSPEITNSLVYGNTLAAQDHHQSNSNASSDPFFSTPDISNRQPRSDFHFDTNISASSKSYLSSHSSYPDFFPGTSSNQMTGRQFLGSETEIPPSRCSSFQNHDVRPNMYR